MKDPRLAAALLTSSPDALADLFDAYGDRLFRYCWGMLRSRELARVALRDTLLVAQANIARLADPEDPESLGPWLYSLARAECRRHQPVVPDDADESPARLGLPAADARLMSWHAAMSLEAAEFEALDLACRHYVDLGQVLGLPPEAAEDLLNRARHHLERALGAEILAGRGPACPGRDAVLAGQPGPLAAEVRERVVEHADGCAACGPEVPRNVSATRVFALLPAPALTPPDRAGVLAALAGQPPPAAPALAQAALIPAPAPAPAPVTPAPGPAKLGPPLASYVRPPEPVLAPEPPVRGSAPIPAAAAPVPPAAPYVAAAVPAAATASPVPETPSAPVAVSKGRGKGRGKGWRLAAGAGVLASAVVIASAIAMAGAGQPGAAGRGRPTLAAGAATGPALQATGQSASPGSSRAPSGVGPAGPAGIQPATPSPLASRAGSTNQVMITAATKPPPPPGQAPGARPAGGDAAATPAAAPAVLQLSAGRVFLGTGSTGQITLTAANGTVSWSASASPPDQVSLSSYGGTLQDGQSVTVMVQVSHGAGAGRADISFQLPGADPVVVPVTWSAQPDDSSGHPGHRHPPPGPSPSSGSMSSTPAPAPTSLGSPAGPGPAAATRPAPGPGGPKLGR